MGLDDPQPRLNHFTVLCGRNGRFSARFRELWHSAGMWLRHQPDWRFLLTGILAWRLTGEGMSSRSPSCAAPYPRLFNGWPDCAPARARRARSTG